MASKSNSDGWGGYRLEFTLAPPDDLKCPICFSVARQPWKHWHCGKVTCESCLEWYKKKRGQGSKYKCPHCKEDDPQFFKDNQSQLTDLINCKEKTC